MIVSLPVIYSNCDEVGDCRLWRCGTNGFGLPIMRPAGFDACVSVRREVYQLLHPDHPIKGLYVAPRCLHKRCLGESCLCAVTRAEYMRMWKVTGVYKNAVAEKKISAKARARTGRTIEDARAIRAELANGVTRTALARKHGVSIDTISNIGNYHTWREGDLAPNASVFNFRA